MADTAKEILERTKKIKLMNDTASERSKGTVSGAFIGMAGGLLFGYYRKYSLFNSAVFGALIGGLAANVLIPKN